MNLDFYLFDVNHGQSAAVKLPNGKWCLFDTGCSSDLSPTAFLRQQFGVQTPYGKHFGYHKLTISHLHGDHVEDVEAVLSAGADFSRVVSWDAEYLQDVQETSSSESWPLIRSFTSSYGQVFGPAVTVPDYGTARIAEMSLSPLFVRRFIGGTANSRVNNASVVTRIDCNDHSILICGDMEKEGWDFALNQYIYKEAWRALVGNVDFLVAPHHGHSSGYSADLMALANPRAVLVSIHSGDPNVDTRYSNVPGVTVGNEVMKRITTRDKGSIHIRINPALIWDQAGKGTFDFDIDGRQAALKRKTVDMMASLMRGATSNEIPRFW